MILDLIHDVFCLICAFQVQQEEVDFVFCALFFGRCFARPREVGLVFITGPLLKMKAADFRARSLLLTWDGTSDIASMSAPDSPEKRHGTMAHFQNPIPYPLNSHPYGNVPWFSWQITGIPEGRGCRAQSQAESGAQRSSEGNRQDAAESRGQSTPESRSKIQSRGQGQGGNRGTLGSISDFRPIK